MPFIGDNNRVIVKAIQEGVLTSLFINTKIAFCHNVTQVCQFVTANDATFPIHIV